MKKKILSFVLAICLIIPAMMFVGCGNKEQKENPEIRVNQVDGWHLSIEDEKDSYTYLYDKDAKKYIYTAKISVELRAQNLTHNVVRLYGNAIKFFSTDYDLTNEDGTMEFYHQRSNEDGSYGGGWSLDYQHIGGTTYTFTVVLTKESEYNNLVLRDDFEKECTNRLNNTVFNCYFYEQLVYKFSPSL